LITNIKSENLFLFKNELIDILIRILSIKSLTGYESELAAFILDFIKSFVNLNEVNVIKERNNIIVFNKEINLDKKNNQVLALVGHIDTVDNVNEYNLRIMDEKVYGLGSSDMKAGIAVMLVLLKYFYKFRNLIWIFYDQEEGSFINNGLNIVFSKYLDLIKNIDLAIIFRAYR
jgi:succinyl-diaminopimelate desuccinylase